MDYRSTVANKARLASLVLHDDLFPICKALQSLAKCWDAAEPATQDLQEYDVKVVFMDLSVISGSHDGMHPSQHPFPMGGTV